MTLCEKTEFINNLVESVRLNLVKHVEQFPEDWDGHELRQLISETFRGEISTRVMSGRRLRAYRCAAAVLPRI